jgi:hypothetical protein
MPRIGIRFATVALSLAWSTQAHAVLINLGDVTRDSATGLDWLDVNLTAGLSHDQVLGGAGGYTNAGWRFATGTELDALATRYIGSPEQTFSGGLDFIETLIMIGLLGPTFARDLSPDHQSTIATLGYYDDLTPDPLVGLGEFVVTLLVPDPAFGQPFTGRWTTFDDFLVSNTVAPQIGSFLVRSPVSIPEPSIVTLLLTAGAFLLWPKIKLPDIAATERRYGSRESCQGA